ncbi:hypothetical protein SAMN04489712_104477 [Thermomonospora echinospora]|uniref:Uncharacterized protein n=1 Tax=Thermomonospora echinospora TaxID=1992 RepID=A0A1H5ZEZ9_9ACTN|nr:hypothetical protein [Thermomonospora echinospora]SEG33966.1 hypothetical protein SAMN04489712_104477 [Thermomonospora echinospora]
MTERSGGAPDPADSPAGGGDAGTAQPAPAFWNLAAVRRSDAVVEALATRRALPADPADGAGIADLLDPAAAAGPADLAGWQNDPAARLLRALIADVDAGAPEPLDHRRSCRPPEQHVPPGRHPRAGGPDDEPGPGGGQRRGSRVIVLLGVVGPLLTGVLATTGVAAAQSGLAERPGPGSGAGERADRGREPQAGARSGGERPDAAPVRGGTPLAAVHGTGWTWPQARPVMARERRDDEKASGQGRDDRKAPRRLPPRTSEPPAADPWQERSPAGDPGEDEPRGAAPEPGGARPFVRPQPQPQPPQTPQDQPGTGEDTNDEQPTDPDEASPAAPADPADLTGPESL